MPETTIADFVARFLPRGTPNVEPITGRVILSPKRLVLASGDGQTTIPLSDVIDVVIGTVPADLAEYFDDTIVVAYRRNGERRTAIMEADGTTLGRFRTVLFKALLGGARCWLKHPGRVGGRVTDASLEPATLHVAERAVIFDGLDPSVRIDLSTVTHFEKTERTLDGESRPALNVRHAESDAAVTTVMVMQSPRRMNLLGRYLRAEYGDLLEDVRDIDISEAETELLVAIYSGAGAGNLAGVLDCEPSTVTMLLNGLEEKSLVTTADGETSLTSLGRLAVGDRVERVNA